MKNSYIAFDYKATGETHVKVQKKCEDACGSLSIPEEGIYICAVADGHGSDNYPRTDRGSEFAVNVAIQCLLDFSRKVDPLELFGSLKEDIIQRLKGSILNGWYKLVESDYKKDSFSSCELETVPEPFKSLYLSGEKVEKAYGTTLIAYVITKNFALGLQIGDGKCVTVGHDGQCMIPIKDDPECYLNITTSICDSDAISEFRDDISADLPIAVFCGSDGVEDSYSSLEELISLYRSMAIIFGSKGEIAGREEIEAYLPILTKRGSGDDVSIAGIINVDYISTITKELERQNHIFSVNNEIDKKTRRKNTLTELLKFYQNKIEENTQTKKVKENQRNTLKDKIKSLIGQKKKFEDLIMERRNDEENLATEIGKVEAEILSLEDTEVKKKNELEKVLEELDSLMEEKRLLEGSQLVGSTTDNSGTINTVHRDESKADTDDTTHLEDFTNNSEHAHGTNNNDGGEESVNSDS